MVDRNAVVATADRAEMANCSAITIHSDSTATSAAFEGLTTDTGEPNAGRLVGDLRPQVVGVFTDMTGGSRPG